MKITILGCGGSGGVPLIDGYWGECNPNEPKNRRFRPSICVDGDEGERIIVDTGPDFREQIINLGWNGRLDAIFYTHHHADHMFGMDDLRRLSQILENPIDIYAHEKTLKALRYAFPHVFDGGHAEFYPTMVLPHIIASKQQIGNVTVSAFRNDHGIGMSSTGYRFNDVVYTSDIWDVPEESWEYILGAKVWILDMADNGNPVHADKEKVLRWVEKSGVERAFLTHLSPRMDYQTLCNDMPEHIRPCYDGMVIEV